METRKQEILYHLLKERKNEVNKTLLGISRKTETLLHFGLESDIIEHQKLFEKLSTELELIEKLEDLYDAIAEMNY